MHARLGLITSAVGVQHSMDCGFVVQPTWIEGARVLKFVVTRLEVAASGRDGHCRRTSVLMR